MNRDELEKTHQQLLQHYNDYVTKKTVAKDDELKISQAKSEWEVSWSKLMETLLILERLEI